MLVTDLLQRSFGVIEARMTYYLDEYQVSCLAFPPLSLAREY